MRCRGIVAAGVLSLSCWTWSASAEEPSAIGYPSVAAALKALRADPTATEKTERGWTIIERGWEIWSFAPADHPAHTSAAKRTMYQDTNGGWRVVTRVLGQSTKASCDALMQEYEQ